jgi:hypothetical protein
MVYNESKHNIILPRPTKFGRVAAIKVSKNMEEGNDKRK